MSKKYMAYSGRSGQAMSIIDEFQYIESPTEEQEHDYVEALEYIIANEIKEDTDTPMSTTIDAMKKLAWFYAERKEFRLERKYLEMAADEGDYDASCELGYMWYYGQHGEVDYAKAYHYFKEGMKGDGENAYYSKYKIADMYRFGLFVEKDGQRYQEMIYELFDEISAPMSLGTPYPEVAYRLAGIEAEKGNTDKASYLLEKAKNFLAERIMHDNYWGSISVMERVIKKLYSLTEFDEGWFDIYDIIYLTGSQKRIRFTYGGDVHEIETADDGGVALDGKWYVSVGAFLEKCVLDGRRLTSIYDELGRMVIL